MCLYVKRSPMTYPRDEEVRLETAANGYAMLSTHSARQRRRLGLLLMFRYGFWRWGIGVPPMADDAVYPSFRRFGLRIDSGWDNWIGYDLLACNEASDEFLRQFHAKHCGAA
jgi:hypothetical protein